MAKAAVIGWRDFVTSKNLLAFASNAIIAAPASERTGHIAADPEKTLEKTNAVGIDEAQLSQRLIAIENSAPIRRVNCGHSSDKHSLSSVRRYQRDVHSPAIARRPGIYEYRHFSFDSIRPHLFAHADGIELDCRVDEQINSLASVLFANAADHALSLAYPPDELRPLLVLDNAMIQKWAAAYDSDGPAAAHTFIDTTGIAVPQGPPARPSFALLLRQRSDVSAFRECVSSFVQRWAAHANVRRLRLTFIDAAQDTKSNGDYAMRNMMAEQKLWHHAWIDLVLDSEHVAMQLLSKEDAKAIRPYVSALHVYPIAERYTYVYAGRPTLVGLRGYAAYQAIEEFHAANEGDPRILRWMYGTVVQDGPIDPSST
ncbi:MAG TPA: hypothetical protein VIY90_09250 [Steroidobacteraceae bacterium]